MKALVARKIDRIEEKKSLRRRDKGRFEVKANGVESYTYHIVSKIIMDQSCRFPLGSRRKYSIRMVQF